MSATHTLFGRSQLLAAIYAHDTYTAPGNLWLALTTTVPGTNDDGTTIIEPPASSGYERLLLGTGSSSWQASGSGELTQVQGVYMPQLTANTALIVGFAIVDSATIGAGNAYVVGSLPAPIQGNSGIEMFLSGLTIGLYD